MTGPGRPVRLERVDLPALDHGAPPTANEYERARRRRENGARRVWRLVGLDGSRLPERGAGLFVGRAEAGAWATSNGYELVDGEAQP